MKTYLLKIIVIYLSIFFGVLINSAFGNEWGTEAYGVTLVIFLAVGVILSIRPEY